MITTILQQGVDITNQHIEDGYRNNCRSCPTALGLDEALKHHIPEYTGLRVDRDDISFYTDKQIESEEVFEVYGWKTNANENANEVVYRYKFPVTGELTQWMYKFDKSGMQSSTTIYLDLEEGHIMIK